MTSQESDIFYKDFDIDGYFNMHKQDPQCDSLVENSSLISTRDYNNHQQTRFELFDNSQNQYYSSQNNCNDFEDQTNNEINYLGLSDQDSFKCNDNCHNQLSQDDFLYGPTQIQYEQINSLSQNIQEKSSQYDHQSQIEQTENSLNYLNIQLIKQPLKQSPQKDLLQPKQKQTKKVNRNNEFVCEETKNIFVLVGPYIQKLLIMKWYESVYFKWLQIKSKKIQSIKELNSLLKEVETYDDGSLIISFRQQINQIFEYDLVKYTQNRKFNKSCDVLVKYMKAIQLILINQSGMFNSIKKAKKVLDYKIMKSYV